MGSIWRTEDGITEGGIISLIRALPFGLWAGILAWLSLSPNPRDSGLAAAMSFTGGDLWSHALAWGVLALLARWAITLPGRTGWSSLSAWALSVGYGALMEGLQMAVPGRGAQWVDLIGDIVGATLGVLVLDAWLRWRSRDDEA